jgi:hypothetical protein
LWCRIELKSQEHNRANSRSPPSFHLFASCLRIALCVSKAKTVGLQVDLNLSPSAYNTTHFSAFSLSPPFIIFNTRTQHTICSSPTISHPLTAIVAIKESVKWKTTGSHIFYDNGAKAGG